MIFKKEKFDVKHQKFSKFVFDVKQLKKNKFIKSIWKLIISTSNATLEVLSLHPCNRIIIYFFFTNKVNGYFEQINRNKYSMLVTTNESKEKIKKR